VKIAFAGKGGSGKTTLSSLFTRYLAAQGLPVVALDADINQHLAEALGAAQPPAMGAHLTEIKEYLRGTNPSEGADTLGSPAGGVPGPLVPAVP
jgi:CO dehydrogenase maturation factor